MASHGIKDIYMIFMSHITRICTNTCQQNMMLYISRLTFVLCIYIIYIQNMAFLTALDINNVVSNAISMHTILRKHINTICCLKQGKSPLDISSCVIVIHSGSYRFVSTSEDRFFSMCSSSNL